MGWFTGFVLYTMVWWVVLFAVLPIGVHAEPGADDTTGWRGVPRRPRMLQKLITTTWVAGLVWLFCVAVIRSPWLSFRTGWLALPSD